MTKPASFFTQELESRCPLATDHWRAKASPAGFAEAVVFTSLTDGRARANVTLSLGVPSEDLLTSQSQDTNLRCMTHAAHHAAALLPVTTKLSSGLLPTKMPVTIESNVGIVMWAPKCYDSDNNQYNSIDYKHIGSDILNHFRHYRRTNTVID
ncbi:UNVERIFIED_CONTAM: hypothetical protein FKN15_009895 [Acipenser sinensis]